MRDKSNDTGANLVRNRVFLCESSNVNFIITWFNRTSIFFLKMN